MKYDVFFGIDGIVEYSMGEVDKKPPLALFSSVKESLILEITNAKLNYENCFKDITTNGGYFIITFLPVEDGYIVTMMAKLINYKFVDKEKINVEIKLVDVSLTRQFEWGENA